MKKYEYEYLQEALTKKLKNHNRYETNEEEIYNKAILAAKSILSDYYHKEQNRREGGRMIIARIYGGDYSVNITLSKEEFWKLQNFINRQENMKIFEIG